MSQFNDFFHKATGYEPFDYQYRLSIEKEMPTILEIPTGLGKTASVIMAWLWRIQNDDENIRKNTPRRLVYCLPIRVLVEQTRDCVVSWLKNLGLYADKAPDCHPLDKVSVHVLMGGDLEIDWDNWPDRYQVLIGTQDMLLSRALNRGYGMSRYRWPMHYALLNNDCLWVMDEVQLMGNGLATSAQLEAFRHQRNFGNFNNAKTVWMSATINDDWLKTVDFDPTVDIQGRLTIGPADQNNPMALARLNASKPFFKANFLATTDGKKEAAFIIDHHQHQSRTLFVANTVKRAQSVYQAIKKLKTSADLVLIHSRFRQKDRDDQYQRLLAEPGENGIIAVSTQVIEAGVDVSSKVLITDLAPWPSMVQRFGRCNRKGEYNSDNSASVFWIEPEKYEENKVAPYGLEEIQDAKRLSKDLVDVGPGSLPCVPMKMGYTHVLRRNDFIELFDTTPDLAGSDIDVSRFIREADERHVQVFWRDLGESKPVEDEPQPRREELCNVPIQDLDLKKINNGNKKRAWRWDHLEGEWRSVEYFFPGLVVMLDASVGGYTSEEGWGKSKEKVKPVEINEIKAADANDADFYSSNGVWQTLSEHTDLVVSEVTSLLSAFPSIPDSFKDAVLLSARWHDVGKGHPIFQEAMPDGAPHQTIWAKSGGKMKPYSRKGFRHELASALAILQNELPDMVAYLAAAHHGKVRLSIRSLPHENRPNLEQDLLFARGVRHGEELPAADLGGGVSAPITRLPLTYMELGDDDLTGPSWLARILELRDSPDIGPLRLAFLETLLRVADWRGSVNKDERKEEEAQNAE